MRRLVAGLVPLAAMLTLTAHSTAAEAAQSAPARNPVVFVHGYTGDASNWNTAKRVFQEAGYSSERLFAYEYNSYGDNRTNASRLATFVKDVKSKTGAAQVDIVNHSMGGLVSLWYLKVLNGNPDVGHLASIAGANHGTYTAGWCLMFTTCRQMYPGSSFIKTLTDGDETAGATKYATWYSSCDGVINPYTSTRLTGATNHEVECEEHVAFLSDTTVLKEIAGFLGT